MVSLLPNNLLVIFDLDETLVFTRMVRLYSIYNDPGDFQIDLGDVVFDVFVRPGARKLIAYCQERFQVGVWSSAKEDYVQALVAQLFDLEKVTFVRHRDHCVMVVEDDTFGSGPVKDLRSLGHPMDQLVIVDDDPATARCNLANLIRVTGFRDNPQGSDLFQVLEELKRRTNASQ